MTDHLFDPEPYEKREPRKPRARKKERAIKLIRPWVLLRHAKKAPKAHLILTEYEVDDETRRALAKVVRLDGSPTAIPRCHPKTMMGVINYDGESPLAPVCEDCAEYATKNRIPMEIVER